MIVIYSVSFLFTKVAIYDFNLQLYFAAYFALVTVLLATVSFGSHALFERRLIDTGRRMIRPAPENKDSSPM